MHLNSTVQSLVEQKVKKQHLMQYKLPPISLPTTIHQVLLLMLWFVFKRKINWTKSNWHLKKIKLNNMYNTIKQQFKNTISFDWVKKYRCQYQCLLKNQMDYLTNKGKWWR